MPWYATPRRRAPDRFQKSFPNGTSPSFKYRSGTWLQLAELSAKPGTPAPGPAASHQTPATAARAPRTPRRPQMTALQVQVRQPPDRQDPAEAKLKERCRRNRPHLIPRARESRDRSNCSGRRMTCSRDLARQPAPPPSMPELSMISTATRPTPRLPAHRNRPIRPRLSAVEKRALQNKLDSLIPHRGTPPTWAYERSRSMTPHASSPNRPISHPGSAENGPSKCDSKR